MEKKGSPQYNNLQRVKGPFKPGTDTILNNQIAEGKIGMKLKGGSDNNKWWNKKNPVKPMNICRKIKNAQTHEDFKNIRNNLNVII